jgi:hypothetical protein
VDVESGVWSVEWVESGKGVVVRKRQRGQGHTTQERQGASASVVSVRERKGQARLLTMVAIAKFEGKED